VRDTVINYLPGAMRVLFGGEKVVEYVPFNAADVALAEQATDYINNVVIRQDNDGFMETYAAVRLSIDNPRWRGVPWFIRSGKMLPMTSTEILVKFKRPVDIPLPENGRMDGDTLRLQLEGEVDNMLTYERLFGYAMEGDPTFFSRQDEVEEQWRVFDGVLGDKVPCLKYKPKTWGPENDNKNVIPPGGWVEPLPVEER
jgi:glucose-6-phosphate 1-dehydrogenase